MMTKNFPMWEEIWISKFMKLIGHKTKPAYRDSFPKHIVTKLLKIKDKERILKDAKEKKLITYKGPPIGCQQISSRTVIEQEKVNYLLKVLKEKTANQEYFSQQSCISGIKERQNLSQKKWNLRKSITPDLYYKKYWKSSFSWNERILISNMRSYENMQHNDKAKDTLNSEL